MKKQELIEKLQTINNQGLSCSVLVSDLIPFIEELDGGNEEKFNGKLTDEMVDELSQYVAESISGEGTDIIDDYDLEMNYREVEVSSIDYNERAIKRIVEQAIKDWWSDWSDKQNG